ncbi:MAG: hydrogenase iron-sulfur subunit [Candidatus Bathyarchaeia archaeon]
MICPSVCPFEALSAEGEPAEVKLDTEKCEVCGICFSTCPASAIETIYYNAGALLSRIAALKRKKGIDQLVLTCQGSSALKEKRVAESEKSRVDNSLTMSLPCVGRVPPELLLRTLSLGIGKIVVSLCEDKYCRFKRGSIVGTRRLLLVQALLNQLGFKPDTLTITKRSVKAHIDDQRCIGCGNCSYTCPFDAIEMEALGSARMDLQACSGCGACATVCPVFAVKLEGFEYETVSESIRTYSSLASRMKRRNVKPAILVLSCGWSDFDRNSNQNRAVENAAYVRLPCAGAVDSLHVLEAFYSGFDGVFIAACKKGECKLEKGNETAENRISSLKKLLAEVNLEDRLEMCFVSPRDVGDLDERIKLFSEKINSLTATEAVRK